MISQILGFLFPPTLPGAVRDWQDRVEMQSDEQGCAGPATPKQYRDGIERHFAEEKQTARPFPELFFSPEYTSQMRNAQKEISRLESQLIAKGYVNLIHDCWERVDD